MRNLIHEGGSMAKVLKKLNDVDRTEWLQLRRLGIGGSDVGAIAGLSKFKTALDVYLDKVGESFEADPPEWIYWGNVLEEVVAREFCLRTGMKVKKRNAIFVHQDYNFMLANVDREVVGENAGLECKTTNAYNGATWEEGIPESYELQCHHYMMVMGYDRMYIACLIGGNKFIYHTIERNQNIIDHLVKLESDFWNDCVLAKKPPRISNTECATGESLLKAYPNAVNEFISFSDSEDFKIDRLLELKQTKNQISKEIEAIETDLKQTIGDKSGALSGKYKVLWGNSISKRIDTDRLKTEKPEIYKSYLKESNSRRFSVKEIQ